ncbi:MULTISPECIES: FUSC family protein [unclassified Streptomyces]|uniref:FUSC family protein n=1 Tax=unclassified Streptomyces TaxID=2593676 RepID=UPI0036EB8659
MRVEARPGVRPGRRPSPAWLSHALSRRPAPVPRTAMVRGALGAGPLLGAGIATGHAGAGVLAALGAMLAGVNDRPGTRRKGVVGIGCPAVAGSLGLLVGAVVADCAGRWSAVPVLFLVGWLSGALSTVGAVWSSAALQMLVTLTIGLGMPMPGPAWFKAVCFLSGAVWLLVLRLVLRVPRRGGAARSSGEREAVAAVFDALADALHALGGPQAAAARRRLVAVQQQAHEALSLMRLLPWPGRVGAAGHPLTARFDTAVALCEASIALLWEGRPVPGEVAEGPRRLAAAVRTGGPAGPLPSPVSDTVERTAFDHALLEAAVVFDRTLHGAADAGSRSTAVPSRRPWRSMLSPAGREYGLRVALCVTVTGAVALLLHEEHWYWLPATAAFLVKPDMGPLFSRVVNRFAGTVAGVLAFLLCGTALGGPGAAGTVALVVVGGALVPFSVRHFGLQTAVITVLVLSFVRTAGDTEAAPARLLETTLACAIVLLVGHLPRLTDPRVRVGHRCAVTLRCAELYLRHVLAGPAEEHNPRRSGAQGLALRNATYRALADARAAAETDAAELPGPYGGKRHDWAAVADAAELIVDAATVCALRVEYGVPRPPAAEVEQVTAALSAAADALEDGRAGRRPGAGPRDCRSLRDVMTHLHGIHTLTADPMPAPRPSGPPTAPRAARRPTPTGTRGSSPGSARRRRPGSSRRTGSPPPSRPSRTRGN